MTTQYEYDDHNYGTEPLGLNLDALRVVAESIRETGRAEDAIHFNFNLAHWARSKNDDDDNNGVEVNICETTFCIAGTTVALFTPREKLMSVLRVELSDDPWRSDFQWGDEAAVFLLLDGYTPTDVEVLDTWLFMAGTNSVWQDVADEFGWDHDRFGLDDWSQITADQASTVLIRIADGIIKPPSQRSVFGHRQ